MLARKLWVGWLAAGGLGCSTARLPIRDLRRFFNASFVRLAVIVRQTEFRGIFSKPLHERLFCTLAPGRRFVAGRQPSFYRSCQLRRVAGMVKVKIVRSTGCGREEEAGMKTPFRKPRTK